MEYFLVVSLGCLEQLPHSFDDFLLGATSHLTAGEGDDGDQMQSMGTPPNPIRFLPLQLEDAPRLKRMLDEIVHELGRTGKCESFLWPPKIKEKIDDCFVEVVFISFYFSMTKCHPLAQKQPQFLRHAIIPPT